jgi:Bacterial regulatory proteins, gntR family
LPPGTRLPSEDSPVQEYAVSQTTIRAAIQSLVQRGLVEIQRGKGTFVTHLKITQELTELTGLVLSLFYERPPFPSGAQVVTIGGIGLFILLAILRVILMLIIFLKERGYQFAAAAAVVLAILIADFAIGTLVN